MEKAIIQFVMLLVVFCCSTFINMKAINVPHISIPTFAMCFICLLGMLGVVLTV